MMMILRRCIQREEGYQCWYKNAHQFSFHKCVDLVNDDNDGSDDGNDIRDDSDARNDGDNGERSGDDSDGNDDIALKRSAKRGLIE